MTSSDPLVVLAVLAAVVLVALIGIMVAMEMRWSMGGWRRRSRRRKW